MPQKVRIALDAMGGDVGASVVIPGAATALSRHPDIEFLMFGDSALIEAQLAKYPALKKASRVTHTDVTVAMHDKPSQALRRGRKNSSMWLAIDAVKKSEADVGGIRRQYRRADGDGALPSAHHAGNRPARHCRRVADDAR